MTAAVQAGALSRPVDWNTINWHSAQHMVRRLQARIVKAKHRVSSKRRNGGLSRMRGNSQVQFLGAGSEQSRPATRPILFTFAFAYKNFVSFKVNVLNAQA
jgi:hypothetical protein